MSENRIAEVIPAIMPESREELLALTEKVRSFAKIVQLDIDDGVFATGKASWPQTHEDFEGFTLPYSSSNEIFWEVHLMVKEPLQQGLDFIQAGAGRIIAHVEALGDANEARDVFDAWHGKGAQVGLALLLESPIATIEELIHDVEEVQVMGIAKIGAQGIPFDTRVLARVRELRNRFPRIHIAVDGGVNTVHAQELVEAGADRLCVGSAIIKATDPKGAYEEILASIAPHL